MKGIITFTVNERPWYFYKVLESWQKVYGIEDWGLQFALEPGSKVENNRYLIDEFDHPNKQIFVNPERYGVLHNPYMAMSRAFQTHSRVILAEEDLIVAKDTLKFFDHCFNRYQDDPKILTVNARGGDGNEPEDQLYIDQHFAVHIWGTWHDRWVDYIEPTWDHDYSTGENGVRAGWDWNLNLRVMPKHDLYGVYPSASRSDNIGENGGTHQGTAEFPDSQAPNFRLDRPSDIKYRI